MAASSSTSEHALYWKRLTCQRPCVICGEADGTKLEAHHVIAQQQLRRAGHGNLLWAEDNGLSACGMGGCRAHPNHTAAVARIPRSKLRPENIDFAERLGLGWYIERFYASDG